MNLVLTPLSRLPSGVEIAERKGTGHPDTICDALGEELSRRLSRHYLEREGRILHHNVDKALLAGGAALPAFGGGEVLEPIDIYLAGRATAAAGGSPVPIADLAVEGSRAWLKDNLHALDPERHVRIHSLVRPGSPDLRDLFARGGGGAVLANDTSCGAGYAPLSETERSVLAVEHALVAALPLAARREIGEDVKVMAVGTGERLHLTVACALVGRFVASAAAYEEARSRIAALARDTTRGLTTREVTVEVNAADDPARESYYLTVTGTSAEGGDDGQIGRGNRASGLITPGRPMSLEALAGKNPVSHVGKLYNLAALRIARALVAGPTGEGSGEVAEAHCFLVSRIGRPIADPEIAEVRLATRGDLPPARLRARVEATVAGELSRLGDLALEIVRGEVAMW